MLSIRSRLPKKPQKWITKVKKGKGGKADNWWEQGGVATGPAGPDTEIFYYLGKEEDPVFDTESSDFVEIWLVRYSSPFFRYPNSELLVRYSSPFRDHQS